MKYRQGFVSNSSTTSFSIYGVCICPSEDKDMEGLKLLGYDGFEDDLRGQYDFSEYVDEAIYKADLKLASYCGGDYYDAVWVGRSWDSMDDDQTKAQFKAQVEADIEKLFGKKFDCAAYEEAWRDG